MSVTVWHPQFVAVWALHDWRAGGKMALWIHTLHEAHS